MLPHRGEWVCGNSSDGASVFDGANAVVGCDRIAIHATQIEHADGDRSSLVGIFRVSLLFYAMR